MPRLARAVLALVLPAVVFVGGARLMLTVAGARADRAITRTGSPLNQRWGGYTRDEVLTLWGGVEDRDLRFERRLLQIDLLFPFVYGGVLIVSIWTLWSMLRGSIHPAWLLLPVFAGMLADWTENLVQLQQLTRYMPDRDAGAIDAGTIGVASAATMVKLVSVTAAFALVVLLFGLVLARRRRA